MSFCMKNIFTQALKKNKKLYFEAPNDTVLISGAKSYKISGDFTDILSINPPIIRENMWGNLLYNIAAIIPSMLNEDDLSYFTDRFPKSIYLVLINSILHPDIPSTKNNIGNTKIIIEDSTGKQFIRFADITALYSKQALYIDLWASWCVPCKYEFNRGKGADSLLSKKGIKRLYISIDDQRFFTQWKENIYSFNLEGNHFIAGEALQKNINDLIYSQKEQINIPRYILVNSDGKIVNPDAPRPSSIGELNKAILECLGTEK